jgi:hypothetical protein
MDVGFLPWAVGDVLLLSSPIAMYRMGTDRCLFTFLGIFSMPRKMCDVGLADPHPRILTTYCDVYLVQYRSVTVVDSVLYEIRHYNFTVRTVLPIFRLHALLDCDSVQVRYVLLYIHCKCQCKCRWTSIRQPTGPFQSYTNSSIVQEIKCSALYGREI